MEYVSCSLAKGCFLKRKPAKRQGQGSRKGLAATRQIRNAKREMEAGHAKTPLSRFACSVSRVPIIAMTAHAMQGDRDAAVAERVAHTIKGAAANVGAEALRAQAFELETLAKAGTMDIVNARVGALESAFARLQQTVQ